MTTEVTLADWDREYALRVVRSVNALRDRFFGFTIPELRDRLVEAGWPISVETLNGILSSKKRRSFTVGEVFCFARVFGVPPEFILLGLPWVDDLPGAPIVERAVVTDALRWIRGVPDSVYDGSPLDPLERYSRLLADLKRENAIWALNGEPRMTELQPGREVPIVNDLLERITQHRQHWLQQILAQRLVSDMPTLPEALKPFVGNGATKPTEPIGELLDERMRETVERDMDRWEAAKADVERMKVGENGRASDSAE